MSKFALPLAALVVLIVGCQQSAVAEQGIAAQNAQDTTAVSPLRDGESAGGEDATMPDMTEAATCVVGDAAPVPCMMGYGAGDASASRVVHFKAGNQTIVFRGKAQGVWWSGTLDGKAAMGYELNRGHVVFSNQALDQHFEYWTKGNEHGTY